MLFSRWGAFVYRFRKVISILTLVLALGSLVLSSQTAGALSAGGWTDPEFAVGRRERPPRQRVRRWSWRDRRGLPRRGRRGRPLAGVPGDDRRLPRRPRGRRPRQRRCRLGADEGRPVHLDRRDVGLRPRRPRDHRRGGRRPDARAAGADRPADRRRAAADRRRAGDRGPDGPGREGAHPGGDRLVPVRARSSSILVFASIVAAGHAARSSPPWRSRPPSPGVYLAAQVTDLSIYVQNVATMLGLALAIDYSLFMVSRFREELRKGRDVGTAVEITVATSGKAVTFSGLAVAIGLSGLLLFEPTALRSFGIGGSIVVGASVFYALTFLPAVLGMLGHRVNSLGVAALRDRIRRALGRPTGIAADIATETRWERMAHWVMARPVAVLIPTLAFLLHPRHAVPAPRAGHPRRIDPAARHREPRGGRRARPKSSRPARPRRSSSSRPSTARRPMRPTSSGSSTTRRPRGPRRRRQGRGAVRRPEGPGHRRRARRRGHRRPVRRPARPAPAGARRRPRDPRGDLHPRLDGPPRGDQPVRAAQPGRHRCRARGPRRPGRRRHHRGRRPRRPGRGLHGQPVGDDPVRDRLDARRERADPVPALRLGRDPDQGRDHDPALDHRVVRRPGVHLPGRQLRERPRLRLARVHRSPATRSSCSVSCSGCRWTTRSCCCRGCRRPTAGPATTRPRSPRAWPRRPASSPAPR